MATRRAGTGPVLSRRGLLAGLGATAIAPALASPPASFLAMRDDAAGRHFATRVDLQGRIAFDLGLPGRGHGIAVAPDRRCAVAVARRPGDFLQVFDPATGAARASIDAASGFFFCGHAVFSADGTLLYATETRAADAEGFVGVYDARDRWRRVAQWPTGGGDPHELLLDGDALVVANGGFGLDEGIGIDPSMVRLHARDGRAIARAEPPGELSQVSLRHIALADGAVFVAGQYAGPSADRPPLVARWDPAGLRFLDLGRSSVAALANYCGSIAASLDGKRLCVTSPRGSRAVVFTANGEAAGQIALVDCCGAAALDDGAFLLTSGRGVLATSSGAPKTTVPDARWDNHVCRV